MTERQRRDRVHAQRLPSRHMRSLLRQAIFRAYRLLRTCDHATEVGDRGERQIGEVLELCRWATAREPRPAWLVAANATMPATVPEAAAMLNGLIARLRDLDAAWRRRLVAAGIDPKWPGDDA